MANMYECVRISVYGSARGTVNLEYRDPLNLRSAVIYADLVYSTDVVTYECILYDRGESRKVAGDGCFTRLDALNAYLAEHNLAPLSNVAIKWPRIVAHDIEVISAANAKHAVFIPDRPQTDDYCGPVDMVEDFQDRFIGALEHMDWPIND
jgi:hypothetical protein